jgi:peptidoglycan/LPS O-acetylase OafA/YrhL
MTATAARQLVKYGLMWLVVAVSLGLLTPWGIAHRQSLEPRFALVAIIFGTLACVASLASVATTAFGRRGGTSTIVIPLCIGISSLLLVSTFLWAGSSSSTQSFALAGAALFMITAAVLQLRVRDRTDSR